MDVLFIVGIMIGVFVTAMIFWLFSDYGLVVTIDRGERTITFERER